MSQVKYCAKCGGQLLPNAKFCASCGAPVSPLPSQVAPVAPTKRKPWFWVIAVVMIILAFLGGASIAPQRPVTVTTTYVSTATRTVTLSFTLVTVGVQRVKIGQTFILQVDGVPFEVTFTKVTYTDKVRFSTAEKGYKFVVVDVTVRNVGIKEATVFNPLVDSWVVKVDKGYVYKAKPALDLPGSVRPEETKTGYLYFEILQETAAVEMQRTKLFAANPDIIVEL